MYPEDLDGYLFESKVNRTISEEFDRISAKVEGAFNKVKSYEKRMMGFEDKIEIVRAQMSRIGKFDGAVESFTR